MAQDHVVVTLYNYTNVAGANIAIFAIICKISI